MMVMIMMVCLKLEKVMNRCTNKTIIYAKFNMEPNHTYRMVKISDMVKSTMG